MLLRVVLSGSTLCLDKKGGNMYAYKVVTTTLMILLIVSLVFSGLKSKKGGKLVCMVMMIITGMGIVAIWG